MKAPAFRFKRFSAKQIKVLTWWMPGSPYRDYDGIVCDGSVRAGKTIAYIDSFITWSQTEFQNEAFILGGKSIGALKRNVLRPMFAILQAKGIRYVHNRTENWIRIGSNIYYCFGANNEASQDVLQGLTAAGLFADEAGLFPRSWIEQAFARCSVEGAKVWLNCNPGNPGHFVKKEIIDKAKAKRFLHLHFVMDDNLTLSEKVKERYRRIYSGVWYLRMVLGLWVAAAGTIYDSLTPDLHTAAKLPRMLNYWVGVDYGTASVTTFWLLGLGADQKLYFVDFWLWDAKKELRQKADAELAQDMDGWLKALGIHPKTIFIPDDAASFMTAMFAYKKAHPGSHIGSLGYATRGPGSVLNGIRSISSLLHIGRLLFSAKVVAKGGLQLWQGYVWDDKAVGEDKPLKENDHAPDAGRYVIMSIRQVWHRWIGVVENAA